MNDFLIILLLLLLAVLLSCFIQKLIISFKVKLSNSFESLIIFLIISFPSFIIELCLFSIELINVIITSLLVVLSIKI